MLTPTSTLRVGTRGSALAVAQADLTVAALRRAYPALLPELCKMTTSGDKKLDLSLIRQTPSGAKGLFTKELEEALLRGEIDVAVHSCKDMPWTMPEELVIAAFLERANTGDVLISKTVPDFASLPQGATIATSSVRRARQLQWARPDLRIEEIRGNVQTRLRKLTGMPDLEGIILAQAGLERLGFSPTSGQLTCEAGTFRTSLLKMLPAIGQGAIALQTRRADAPFFEPLNHPATWRAVTAERELMRLLNGDCTLPVGVATHEEGDTLHLETILFGAENEPPRHAAVSGSSAAPLAVAAAACEALAAR
ncbi:MAG TPA: hydroxymethylbilane synthase [Chthoniobacteraceae bacterium]|nr:hydroxymethylbilane synthase [Chthoniobacteraceae bacterium]